MVHKMTSRTSSLKTISLIVLILFISFVKADIDFCSSNKPNDVIALMSDQKHIVNLGDYIRGYNLQYDTNNSDIAVAWNPINQISTQPNPFNQGYKIVNVDVLETNDKKWNRQGIVFAQKDTKSVGISTALYAGTKSKRQNATIQYFTLPKDSNCFSAQIVDTQFNAALDCQTVDGNQDLVCYTNWKTSKITCTSIDSLNEAKDRKSEILYIKDEVFLVTATYSRDSKSSDMTYLTIYHVSQEYIDFVNIIDGYQLGLNHDILISDFDIAADGTILVNDMKMNQIHWVKYSLPNTITKISTFTAQHPIYQIQVTSISTLLISNGIYVIEYYLDSLKPGAKYQLDKGDNEVINIQFSTYGIVIQTSKRFIYVYQPMIGAINYLLAKVDISNKDYLIAPYSNALYTFDQNKQYIHEISSGYLVLSNIDQDITLSVMAKSSQTTCSITLKLLKQTNKDKIIIKQDITNKHFTTQAGKQFSLNLQDIYSGSNLKFTAPQSTDKITYNVDQMKMYDVVSQVGDAPLTQIVSVSQTTFMMLKLIQRSVNIEKCQIMVNGKAFCSLIFQRDSPTDAAAMITAGKQRSNGDIIFAWACAQGKVGIVKYENDSFSFVFIYTGYLYDFSSITITQSHIFFVMKKYSIIQAIDYRTQNYKIYPINKDNFMQIDPNIQGFYPRQVFAHPRIKDLFYIKFPTSLCLMTFIGSQPTTVECNQVIGKPIPSDRWTAIMGLQNYIIFTPDQIVQYSNFGSLPIKLHNINLTSDYTFPLFYNQFANTIVMKTVDNQLIYYKLGKPVIDSLYYSQNQNDNFISQGYWTYFPGTGKVYKQSLSTRLTANAIIDDKQFKQDFKLTIKVSSPTSEEISTQTDIVVINYSTHINSNNRTNDIISLPQSASNVKIPIKLQNYFEGPVQTYEITCPYCDNKALNLETTFKNPIVNAEIIGSDSIVQVFNNNVLILSNNRINLVNNQNVLQSYAIIEITKKCTSMGYHSKVGALVFCSDVDGQQIHLFSVSEHQIKHQSNFVLHEQSSIQTADQILIQPNNANSVFVFIQDNDISNLNQNLNKHANVKAFILNLATSPSQDTLQFKGTISSTHFGTESTLPINDIDIQNGFIFATIGNIGLGYAKLQVSENGILSNPTLINFSTYDQLSRYVLDDSLYQQVQIIQFNTKINKVNLFVTSTISLHIVINFQFKNQKLTFLNVAQTYNRYGSLNILNWQFITSQYILLSYYNKQMSSEHIVYYPRGQKGMINFIASLKILVPQNQLLQHDVFLSSDHKLWASDVGRVSVDPKINRFQVLQGFNLIANYAAASDFSKISIKAINAYTNANTTINVNWSQDDNGGLKWYTVVIIALLVLLIVGISYGMYLKMLKNRKDKKVSLLTQNQADQEV